MFEFLPFYHLMALRFDVFAHTFLIPRSERSLEGLPNGITINYINLNFNISEEINIHNFNRRFQKSTSSKNFQILQKCS